jgi:Cu+-exporting ATPase
VERGVSHPFAEAIVAEAARCGVSGRLAPRVENTPGAGAEGEVDGTLIMVGSASWLRSRGIAAPEDEAAAASSVWVSAGTRLAGEVRFADPLRPEAAGTLAALKRMGVRTGLLSGDRDEVARRIGAVAGLDAAEGALSPAGKTARIEHERRTWGAVAMVGEGLNDAGALGAADVGIAFGRAADLAREHADVSVLREDLGEVVELIRVARRTLSTVRGNLAWAFVYNLAGIGLAAAGLLSPIVAAGAMVLSSLFVVWNSTRLGAARAYIPSGTTSSSGRL